MQVETLVETSLYVSDPFRSEQFYRQVLVDGTTAPEENRELFVFQKEDGVWKIARYMFNKTS